ncbi:MAG: peptidoglycan recognition protein family protein [Ardenticatenaceae bacterium]|nr:peptidoglycan recognition protein family protein [Ardenticatenaceae bacterium]
MRTRLRFAIVLCLAVLATATRSTTAGPSSETLAATWSFDSITARSRQLTGLTLSSQRLALDPTAERGQLISAPLSADFEFIALGATWAEGAEPMLEVRVSADGKGWSAWEALPLDADHRSDGHPANGTDLLFTQGRFAQLRLTLTRTPAATAPAVRDLTLTYLDTRRGPAADEAARLSTQSLPGEPPIIARAGWGADESYRFNPDGSERWPREYRLPQKFFLHHTATSNTILDPAAAVRAVYYYHAVTRGWGDIGYHFVIDQQGRIYEGRAGGEQGRALVVGGHTYGYNYGSVGVATLGNFQETAYPAAAEASLTSLLAARANRYGVHPLEGGFFVDRWWPNNILGHRDAGSEYGPTECPGDGLYYRLPTVRQTTWNKLLTLDPWVSVPSLPNPLVGQQTFGVDASPAVTRIDLHVDGVYWGTDPTRPFSIILTSAGLAPGRHVARVTAYTEAGRSAVQEQSFDVAPPTPTPTATSTPGVPPPPRAHLWLPMLIHSVLPAPIPYPGPATPGANCRELLVNGTMEDDTGWLPSPTTDEPPVFTTERARSGARSLRAGLGPLANRPAWSSARQFVSLPFDATSATLDLWLKPEGASASDRQYLLLLDENGARLRTLLATTDSGDWRLAHYDLRDLIGRRVFIYVGVKNDGQGDSARLYLDDASLLVCQD